MNKKLVIIFLAVTLISVGVTSLLISMKPSNNDVDLFASFGNVTEKEKGIDLNGTYDMNDLEFIEEVITYDELEHTVRLISGLKDSKVEKQINNEIRNTIMKDLEAGFQEVYITYAGNFANILSLEIYSYKNIDIENESIEERMNRTCLNYDLRNGEQIKFEDLFTKDANVSEIVKDAFKRDLIINNYYALSDEFYRQYNPYDEESYQEMYDELHSTPVGYDDDQIYKDVKKFLNEKEKRFLISPDRIVIYYPDLVYSTRIIKVIDHADSFKFYDNYKTTFSLFKKNNIGAKDIFTCADYSQEYMKCVEKGFLLDNLYVDYTASINDYYENQIENLNYDYYALFRKEKADEFQKEIKEMKEIAKNDKSHYYVLLMGFEDAVVSLYENYPYYEDENDMYGNNYISSNAVVYTKSKVVYKAPISLKDTMIDYIIDSYRAEYFTYSVYKSLMTKDYETYNEYIENGTIEVTDETNYEMYNYLTRERLETLDDVFYDNLVTEEDLLEFARRDLLYGWRDYDANEVETILSKGIDYTFDQSSIKITPINKYKDEDNYVWSYFSNYPLYYFKIFDDKYVDYYKKVYENLDGAINEYDTEIIEIEEPME